MVVGTIIGSLIVILIPTGAIVWRIGRWMGRIEERQITIDNRITRIERHLRLNGRR